MRIAAVLCSLAYAAILAGCEGKQRYYPDTLGQGGAPPEMRVEMAAPPLQPTHNATTKSGASF